MLAALRARLRPRDRRDDDRADGVGQRGDRLACRPTDSARTISATIAAEMGEVVVGGAHWSVLFFLGALLFVVTFVLNLAGRPGRAHALAQQPGRHLMTVVRAARQACAAPPPALRGAHRPGAWSLLVAILLVIVGDVVLERAGAALSWEFLTAAPRDGMTARRHLPGHLRHRGADPAHDDRRGAGRRARPPSTSTSTRRPARGSRALVRIAVQQPRRRAVDRLRPLRPRLLRALRRRRDRRRCCGGELVWGQPALLWASLTLAVLTLPVVIVATEEALRAVPRELREASARARRDQARRPSRTGRAARGAAGHPHRRDPRRSPRRRRGRADPLHRRGLLPARTCPTRSHRPVHGPRLPRVRAGHAVARRRRDPAAALRRRCSCCWRSRSCSTSSRSSSARVARRAARA